MDDAPLILTLGFDTASFARFDAERRRYFPPERNLVPAHLTLFHHLPGERLAQITAEIGSRAARVQAFALSVRGVRFLGRGTAYEVASRELAALRAELATLWRDNLTGQDAQPFRPHVTIQNKTPAAAAKAVYAELSAAFVPFEATASGLLLWHYRAGPWQPAAQFPFAPASPATSPARRPVLP